MSREDLARVDHQREGLNGEVPGEEGAQRLAARVTQRPIEDPEPNERRAGASSNGNPSVLQGKAGDPENRGGEDQEREPERERLHGAHGEGQARAHGRINPAPA